MQPSTSTTYVVSKKNRFSIFFLAFAVLCLIAAIAAWYFLPAIQQAYLDKDEWTLVHQGESFPSQAIIENEIVYISVPFIQEHLDENLFWDDSEQTAVISTTDKLLLMSTQQLTAYINNNPTEITAPPKMVDDTPFLPGDILAKLYHLDFTTSPQYKRIVMHEQNQAQVLGTVINGEAHLREEPMFRSSQLATLNPDEQVTIWGEDNGYYFAGTDTGLLGYVNKKDVKYSGVNLVSLPIEQRPSWRPMGGKINLVWEYVGRVNPDTSKIAPMPGLNVVSPTWFHLKDEEGNLENNASMAYVNWAHDNGYQVWGLITNHFDRDLTHAVLSSTATRQKVINQLLVLAQLYELDGINIDFENMHLKDKDALTQFMRELTPLAREQGLTVSIDVTIRSSSENWSMIYDRPALGEIVDYVIVMTYDEHWAASPKAGSVASLPWVERGLVGVLEQVPKDKVVLGMPFYTRVWEEAQQADGSIKVSSRALSMAAAEKLIEDKGAPVTYDQDAQQDYAQWTEGNSTFKIWLENEGSIAKRVQLAMKYDLAGVASWRRAFEKSTIWPIIETELK